MVSFQTATGGPSRWSTPAGSTIASPGTILATLPATPHSIWECFELRGGSMLLTFATAAAPTGGEAEALLLLWLLWPPDPLQGLLQQLDFQNTVTKRLLWHGIRKMSCKFKMQGCFFFKLISKSLPLASFCRRSSVSCSNCNIYVNWIYASFKLDSIYFFIQRERSLFLVSPPPAL